MGVAAKITLIVAMVAIVIGAQLLEREIASRRDPVVAAARRAGIVLGTADPGRPPIAALTAPLPDVCLPTVPAGAPETGAASGTPGIDDAPTTSDGERAYVIRPGDTLSKIAKKTLGRESAWQLIYQRNRAEIPDAARLKVGGTLKIPALVGAAEPRDHARRVPPRKLTTAPRAR